MYVQIFFGDTPIIYDIKAKGKRIEELLFLFEKEHREKKNYGTVYCFQHLLKREKVRYKAVVPVLYFTVE